MEERKEQVIKYISQLEDYNNEIEKERFEKHRLEMACRDAEVISEYKS